MNDFRKDFPLIYNNASVYLDNAATVQRPQIVIDAVKNFMQTQNANPMRGLYELSVEATKCYEDARHIVAKFLNAQNDNSIVFTRNTTESINLVAYSYGLENLHKGDEIVLSIMEHHSNLLPWQMVARKTGATLKFLFPNASGIIPKEEYTKKITPKCKIVAITQVSNVLGGVNPIKDIAKVAHKVGAIILVDAAQSVPHISVDVKDLNIDFLAFSGHKIGSPMGIGVLYGKLPILEAMSPFLTGGEMIEYVTQTSATFATVPHKFEAGTVNVNGAVGLATAIQYLTEVVGIKTIQEHDKALVEFMQQGLKKIPYVHIVGSSDSSHCGIVTFTIEGVHPHDIASVLDSEKIAVRAGHHCAQPLMEFLGVQSTARASVWLYNTQEEIQRFLDVICKVRGYLGYGD